MQPTITDWWRFHLNSNGAQGDTPDYPCQASPLHPLLLAGPVLFGDTKQTLISARSARVKGNGSRQIFYVVASQVLEDALCPMAIEIECKDAARSFAKLQSNSLHYTIHPIQIRWGVVMLWFVPVGEIPAGMRVNGYLFPIERNKAKGRRATF